MDMETGLAEGQPDDGFQAVDETTAEGTQSVEGQSSASDQTTVNSGTGTQQQQEQVFFDVNDLPQELLPAYKNMQAAFSRKTQEISADRHKVEAYNNFEANPLGTLQTLAQQYGYQLIQPNPNATQAEANQSFEPQTWDDVLTAAEKQAEEKILKKLEPLIGKVQELQQSNTESFLDNNFPDWRQYEDRMLQLMKAHPTLASDPGTLYKMALPEEVVKARATKSALNRLNANTQNATVSGQSTTTKQASNQPAGPLSFNQAVEVAKARIASGRGLAG